MNKEIKNIYQKAKLMIFHLLLSVDKMYRWTKMKEEEHIPALVIG